eukprot:4600545-Pleurochrysis_carterae.AAC.1
MAPRTRVGAIFRFTAIFHGGNKTLWVKAQSEEWRTGVKSVCHAALHHNYTKVRKVSALEKKRHGLWGSSGILAGAKSADTVTAARS